MKYLHLIIAYFVCILLSYPTTKAQAQNTIKAKQLTANTSYQKIISAHFTDYRLLTLDLAALNRALHLPKSTLPIQLQLTATHKLQIQTQPYSICSASFALNSATPKGIQTLPFDTQIHYLAKTQNNQTAQLTLDETVFYATFVDKNQTEWTVQPLSDFVIGANNNQLIMYRADAVRTNKANSCGANSSFLDQTHLPQNPLNRPNSTSCIEEAQLALATDYALLQRIGTPQRIAKYLLAVVNNYQAIYAAVGIHFTVSELLVSNCPTCDTWGAATNSSTLLNNFKDWGNGTNSGFMQPYNVAQLWSGSDFDGQVVGLGAIASVCKNTRYSVVQETGNTFLQMRMLSAHELGHNFGALHDPSSTNFIMRPTITGSATAFSAASINSITHYIVQQSCFSQCTNCHSISNLFLYNRQNQSSQITWIAPPEAQQFAVTLRQLPNNMLLDSLVTTDTFKVFTALEACKGYRADVYSLCANGGVSPLSQSIIIDTVALTGIQLNLVTNGANISWLDTGLDVNIRWRPKGTTTWVNSVLVDEGSYTITGLPTCTPYEVQLRPTCQTNVYAKDTILQLNPAAINGVIVQKASATTVNLIYFPANSSYNYRAQIRNIATNQTVFDALLPPNVSNLIGNLQPCTNYQAVVFADCADGSTGSTATNFFTTADLAIISLTPTNCNTNSSTYNLDLSVGHNHLSPDSNGFTIWVDDVPYPQTYTTTPQNITIPNLPITADTVNVTISDNVFGNSCVSSRQYVSPPMQCACSVLFFEGFEGCYLPNGWTNNAIGTTTAAKWQIGTTTSGHSLDGSCMAFFDDDAFDENGGETVQLTSPSIDLSNYNQVSLQYDYNFNTIAGSFKTEVWNGTAWTTVMQKTSMACGWWGCTYPKATIDVSEYINAAFKIRFTYTDGNGWDFYAAVDNVQLCGFSQLNTCQATFSYSNNTFCANNDYPSPTITGNPNGTFSAIPAGLSINANNGLIDLAASTPATYVVSYTSPLGCTATQTVQILPNCVLTARLKVLLQGNFNSTSNTNPATLKAAGLLPTAQPYRVAPFYYFGDEAVALPTNIPNNVTDWLLLELRDATNPAIVLTQKAAFLLIDGTITDFDAPISGLVSFEHVPNGAYYVAIKHRNHLPVMSAAPIELPNNSNLYSFIPIATRAYGQTQAYLKPNVYGMFAADIDGNGTVQILDFNAWLLQIQNNTNNVYNAADTNLDGLINNLDFEWYKQNAKQMSVPFLRY
ncbi:MAG: hypothetical protein IPN94_18140 [Sphingobacteriales bacterium]|nr:hypothetical protein [Sphingobacteriales bacterium]